MKFLKSLVEYYDELYPITSEQKTFYEKLKSEYPQPVRFLHIGCGTGTFEHNLSKEGSDVTGIENSLELVTAANLKRRTQLMSIRFFQLPVEDLSKYLAKNFYNVISCLNTRLCFMKDKTMLKNFFFDCKELISDNGTVVFYLYNFKVMGENEKTILRTRESLRIKLLQHLTQKDEKVFLTQKIKNSNGKTFQIMEDEEVLPIYKEDIERLAKEAGFSSIQFFNSFALEPFSEQNEYLLCILKP